MHIILPSLWMNCSLIYRVPYIVNSSLLLNCPLNAFKHFTFSPLIIMYFQYLRVSSRSFFAFSMSFSIFDACQSKRLDGLSLLWSLYLSSEKLVCNFISLKVLFSVFLLISHLCCKWTLTIEIIYEISKREKMGINVRNQFSFYRLFNLTKFLFI